MTSVSSSDSLNNMVPVVTVQESSTLEVPRPHQTKVEEGASLVGRGTLSSVRLATSVVPGGSDFLVSEDDPLAVAGGGVGVALEEESGVDPVSVDYERHSSYIIRRVANGVYGESSEMHALFNQQSDEFIESLVENFKREPLSLENVLKLCGRKRADIACETKSRNRNEFGIMSLGNLEYSCSNISNYSKEYAEKIENQLAKSNEDCFSIRDIFFNKDFTYYDEQNSFFMEISSWMMRFNLKPSEGCHIFTEAIREIKINEITYPMATFYFFKGFPGVGYVQHLPTKYHKGILIELQKLFDVAMSWDKKDIVVLVVVVGRLQYFMANACLYMRGSAAICDWIEKFIYRYHGLEIAYHPDKCINLEAIVTSLEEFLEVYPSCIHLKRAEMSPEES
jgi:hypothetical protein